MDINKINNIEVGGLTITNHNGISILPEGFVSINSDNDGNIVKIKELLAALEAMEFFNENPD